MNTEISRSHLPAPLLLLLLLVPLLRAQDPETPRPEHPRADFRRAGCKTLNGDWLFRVDPEDRGLTEEWFQSHDANDYSRIIVPFAWQSEASGIHVAHAGVAWYRRDFQVPQDWRGKRFFVIFEAVEQEATVWVNREHVGDHQGGHTPFEFDITDRLVDGAGDNEIVVRVVGTATVDQPRGQPNWSGILQTVRIEARPSTHLAGLRILPDLDRPGADFVVEINHAGEDVQGNVTVTFADSALTPVSFTGMLSSGSNRVVLSAAIPQAHPWEPGDPHLYEVTVSVAVAGTRDDVSSYFGMRDVRIGTVEGNDRPVVLLNGKPISIAGVSHHGLNRFGGPTALSDAMIRNDVELALTNGFNAIRLHATADAPRFHFWCDRLGCLVLHDLPGFARPPAGSRKTWETSAVDTIGRAFNHPSIIAWTLFSEAHGDNGVFSREEQEWVRSMVKRVRELDPTRIVDDSSSPGRDHVDTDLDSFHFLVDDIEDHTLLRERLAHEVRQHVRGSTFNFVGGNTRQDQPLIIVPYGISESSRGDQDISHSLHVLTTLVRAEERVIGAVYCNLTDIGGQHRGIANFDRSAKEFGYGELSPGFSVADLVAADFLGVDSDPIQRTTPGGTLELPIFIGHFSRRQIASDELALVVTLDGTDNLGRPINHPLGSFPARWSAYRVTRQAPISITLPPTRDLAGALTVTLTRRENGERLAANFVPVIAAGGPAPRVEVTGDRKVILRVDPTQYSFTNTIPLGDRRRDLLRLPGEPTIEYRIEIPPFVELAALKRIGFQAELAAFGNASRLDWPERRHRNDHPQTDGRRSPSTVTVRLAGPRGSNVALPDAPADLRGFVSLASGYPNGIHGFLGTVWLKAPRLRDRTITVALEVRPGGAGLTVFGATMGRYLVDPAIILELDHPVTAPANIATLSAARDVFGSSVHGLLPTAEEGVVQWRYTTTRPPGDWIVPDFDDENWNTGVAPFGSPSPSSDASDGADEAFGTTWKSRRIWLRARFVASTEDLDGPLFLRLCHAESIEVALNGKEIFRADGVLEDYETVPLPTATLESLHEGKNVIAVHCLHAVGKRRVDVGVLVQK